MRRTSIVFALGCLALSLGACRDLRRRCFHRAGEVAPPSDYIKVEVEELVPLGASSALLVGSAQRDAWVPIYIGGTEAQSIQLRLDRRRFERPLTHDLLDAVLDETGGELVRVQLDDLRRGTYIGSITVRHDGRISTLDARPSDAIALALGRRVPIFASKRLLDRAGRSLDAVRGEIDAQRHAYELPPE